MAHQYPYVYMYGPGSDSDVGVYGGHELKDPVKCVRCSANGGEDFICETIIQMEDHLELVHLARGHTVWPGNGGSPGLKGVKRNAERYRAQLAKIRKKEREKVTRKSKKVPKTVHD